MLVKTEPSIPSFESKLSGKKITKEAFLEAAGILKEEGYRPKMVYAKRSAIPGFSLGIPFKLIAGLNPEPEEENKLLKIPIKIVADFDPQLEESDILFVLRKDDGQFEPSHDQFEVSAF